MNYTTAIFLVSDDVRCITVTYEDHDEAPRYMFKSMDDSIKVDDYVVIPTNSRHKMTVAKVVEVDEEIDLDKDIDMKWIVGTIDTVDFENLKEQEEAAMKIIKGAERRRRRAELRAQMLDDIGEETIKAIPIFEGEAKETDGGVGDVQKAT